MTTTAILDTTALDAFFKTNLFTLLLSLFDRVRIPERVEREFLNNIDADDRYSFLVRTYDENHWVEKCTEYDLVTVALLKAEPDIHAGEAEVISQYSILGTGGGRFFAILDDQRAREVARRMSVEIRGTLALLARLDLMGMVNYNKTVGLLVASGSRFRPGTIRDAYAVEQQRFASGIQ